MPLAARTLPLALVLLLGARALGAAGFAIAVTPVDPGRSSVRPADLTVRVGGALVDVLSVTPVAAAGGWRLTIVLDAPRLAAEELAAACDALAAVAPELVGLGAVEVVLADPAPQEMLAAGRGAARLRAALRAVPGDAASTGEALGPTATRHPGGADLGGGSAPGTGTELGADFAGAGGAAGDPLDELLGWLGGVTYHGPRALLWVTRGTGFSPARLGELGKVAAASGWTLAVLPPRGAAARGLAAAAEATGGALLPAGESPEPALAGLAGRSWVTWTTAAGAAAGEPAPLAVEATGPGLSVGAAPAWAALLTPEALSTARARRFLAEPDLAAGKLAVSALMRLPAPALAAEDEDETTATLETRADLASHGLAGAAGVRITTLLTQPDAAARLAHFTAAPPAPAGVAALQAPASAPAPTAPEGAAAPVAPWGAEAWVDRRSLTLPADLDSAVVVVEDLASGIWGAALGAATLEPAPGLVPPGTALPSGGGSTPPALASPAGTAAAGGTGSPSPAPTPPGAPSAGGPPPSSAPGPAGAPSAPGASAPERGLIRLVPPRRRPATGDSRFQVLTAAPSIARVTFLLDGEPTEEDTRAPFSAILDLGPAPRARTVTAIAYDGAGRELDRDAVTVNRAAGAPFEVVITAVRPAGPGGIAEAEVAVALPAGATLASVEVALNDGPGERLAGPPFHARLRLPEPPGPSDYLRAVATLADGTTLEDVWLLAAPGAVERVAVNLVELHVVVTGKDGTPVDGLTPEDFDIRLGGGPVAVERFAAGQEVPLALGLVLDSSGSMWALLPDTQRAASGFLGQILSAGDRAFVVDFASQARLLQPATGDIRLLVRALARLVPEGTTALYDALVFSLLQFEEEEIGRRALVVLTDGDNLKSHFGPGRAMDYGRELGVPIYFVGLAGIEDPRRGLKRSDLDAIAQATGGRAYYVSDAAQIDGIYGAIEAELRSQYTLAFATEQPLTPAELAGLEVSVEGAGRRARVVVGARGRAPAR